MADFLARIKPKRSTVSGEVPSSLELEVGELAISTADAKLFTKHTDGTIKTMGGGAGGGSIDTIEDIGNVAGRQISISGLEWSGSDLSAGGWQYSGGTLYLGSSSADGTDVRGIVADMPTTGTVWISFDDVDYTETAYTNRAIPSEDTVTIDLAASLTTPPGSTKIFLTFDSPYVNGPSFEDDMLLFDAAANVWRPTPYAINGATDVSTASLADGDVLEWGSSTWKPLTLAAVAKTGSYSDLSNQPTIPSSIDDLSDVDTSTTAPAENQVLVWNGSNWVPGTVQSESGGSEVARATASDSRSLSPGAHWDGALVGLGKAGLFLKVAATHAAWIRFYASTDARAADVNRAQDENPERGSGVLLELVTAGPQVFTITPSVHYFNVDDPETANLHFRWTNLDPSTRVCQLTVNALVLEQ